MRNAFIKLLLDPWMHCQLADRVPVVDLHDLRPLFHFILSDPGFNRDLELPVSHRRVREHFIKKTIQIIRVK